MRASNIAFAFLLLAGLGTAQAQSAPATAALEPLISAIPAYPAAARGSRGFVEVEFTVTATGTVENPRVARAEPGSVFDAAALSAVARRRYPAEPQRAPQTLTERIEFAPPARSALAADTAGPMNRCVREDAVYNYGESVDVGLINACSEPLVVFGCAQGTGKNLGQWTCSNSEQRGDVLVQTGDERLGRRFTAGDAADIRTYTYRDSFSLTRAPNSQLWWVACAEADRGCRSDARLWTRAMSGQDASVDPQARSPVAVASSD
jgi:TonB family protein